MSFDKIVISKKHNGLLRPSWIAGTNPNRLQNIMKLNDIELVNVPETCDKISTVINKRKSPTKSSDVGLQDSAVPFRILSNLYFGTIRIHHQQVLNLFERTRCFLKRSSFKIKEINAFKRSSSCTKSYVPSKKRRIQSNKFKFETNFIDLIKESESIQNLNAQLESGFSSITENFNVSSSLHEFGTSIQIREMTIREVSIDYVDIPELNEEFAFGNATLDEQAEILELFNYDSSTNQATKNDFQENEPEEDAMKNIQILSKDDNQKDLISRNLYKIDANLTQNEISSDLHKSGCKEDHNSHKTDLQDCMEERSDDQLKILNDIKCTHHEEELLHKKLIIDKSIKLTEMELISNREKYKIHQCIPFEQIKILPKTKRSEIRNLFTKLNRTPKIKLNFRKDRFKSHLINSTDLIHTIDEIVGHSTNKLLAAEIVEQFKKAFPSSLNRRKRKNTDLRKVVKPFLTTHSIGKENNILLQPDINNNETSVVSQHVPDECNERYGKRICLNEHISFQMKSQLKFSKECGQQDVIMKLLDSLKDCKKEFVEAKLFICNASSNKRDAVIIFYNLLELTASKFITIKKDESTSQILEIGIGPALKELMKNIQSSVSSQI